MEVFLMFSEADPLQMVEATMQAWERIQWADPFTVVQAPVHRFEIKRRALADAMATEPHYILTDLGCVPENERAIPELLGKLTGKDGLIGLTCGAAEYPTGVRVISKGAVKSWPAQVTPQYDKEHAQAVRAAGKNVGVWPITYKRLQEC